MFIYLQPDSNTGKNGIFINLDKIASVVDTGERMLVHDQDGSLAYSLSGNQASEIRQILHSLSNN
ncbi:hypothetical protein D082_04800 [Synechocystis sp. PCC 6714]|nr:hypothetical protein D082_04800 [Synechocystis sp. PCC 6714]